MSGKSEPSKRSRQNTNENPYATDVHTYIAEKEEEIKDLQKANEDLKETLKHTKQDLNKSQIENEKLSTYVKKLIEVQKTFAEHLFIYLFLITRMEPLGYGEGKLTKTNIKTKRKNNSQFLYI